MYSGKCLVTNSSLFGKQKKRVGLLMAFAAFQGASIGPLIDLAIQIDSRYDGGIS